jgi:uncharacterized protein (TIGR02996 family)
MHRFVGVNAIMGIQEAFLHDILSHPEDDAPRLIYADWLDERNDPRGEFIRVQCALAHLSDVDPRRWPLEQREQELLREHEPKWQPKGVGNACCSFRRGFVEEVTLFTPDFLTAAGTLFEQTPLQHVCLRTFTHSAERERVRTREGVGWDRIVQSPHLARLRGLSVAYPLRAEDLRSLSESPYLVNLTELKLVASPLLEGVSIDRVAVLHRSPLRSLTLSQTALEIEDLPALANASSLTCLRELNLNDNYLRNRAAMILAEGLLLPQLETLHLNSNLLGDAGALAIREWPPLPRLTRLSLGHNQIFAAGIQALAEAPALRGLISLDLFGNISCDAGASALASTSWSRLQALNLRFSGVGDKGVRALAHSATLSQLTRLDLTANRITSDGARALVESRGLPSLARLDLLRNDIAAGERERLRDRFGPYVYC